MGDDPIVGRRLGGFEILEVLGHGGFATVYRARQLRLGRDVALKILDPMLARDPNVARRFDREGWAAAGLDHPAIVPVYEAGDEEGIYYLAMRLVAGRSLAEELVETGPLRPERTVAVARAVGDALDHAHSRGVLHRDVKPANILVEGDRIWLSDFGIAATAELVGAYTSGAIGTAAYMAPEQARAGAADARTDLYALGCVAFECIAGRPPYSGAGFAELIYAHTYEPIPRLGDPSADAFFATALAKLPADRFQSGHELAAELDRVMSAGRIPAGLATLEPSTPASESDEATVAAETPREPAPPPTRPIPPPGRPRRRRAWLFALAGAVVLLGAIVAYALQPRGSPAKRAASSTTSAPSSGTAPGGMTKDQAAAAYRGAVASVNAAQATFVDHLDTWTTRTPASTAQSEAQPFVAALVDVQQRLAGIAAGYPAAAAVLNADAGAADVVQTDLYNLRNLNTSITLAAWSHQYDADIAKLKAASDAVRAELGLPATAT